MGNCLKSSKWTKNSTCNNCSDSYLCVYAVIYVCIRKCEPAVYLHCIGKYMYSWDVYWPLFSQVLVRPSPSPDDNQPVVLSARAPDSSIQINVRSSWWLVEDYAAFAMLSRTVDPTAVLGIVDVVYTINFTIQNFMNEE